jgi:hypothetical protein
MPHIVAELVGGTQAVSKWDGMGLEEEEEE